MISIQRLRQELADPAQEHMLEEIRQSVIELWERETGQLWAERAEHVETFEIEHDHWTTLFLGLRPATAIASVETRSTYSATWEELDAELYELLPASTLVRVGAYWPTFVRVTYSGGYTDSTCPAVIRGALAVQARFMLKRMHDVSLIVRSQNFEGGSGVYENAHLHPHFATLAKAYRRKVG